jgi:GT2 family glycosyltransferase
MRPRIVATVLAHGNQFGLDEVLRRLHQQTVPPVAVVVLDNGSSTPLSVTEVPVVPTRLVRSETNVGVGAGHNRLIEIALEHLGAEAVWVLEHDTFPDPDCLAELLRSCRTLAAPWVVIPDVARNYERQWLGEQREGPDLLRFFTFNGPLIDHEAIRRTGGLDERFFVGQEDRDYARRLEAAGVHLHHSVSAVVTHAHRGSRRFGSYVSPARLYYSVRSLAFLQPPTGVVARLRGFSASGAKALYELAARGRGRQYARARFFAYRDAVSGRMGRSERKFS